MVDNQTKKKEQKEKDIRRVNKILSRISLLSPRIVFALFFMALFIIFLVFSLVKGRDIVKEERISNLVLAAKMISQSQEEISNDTKQFLIAASGLPQIKKMDGNTCHQVLAELFKQNHRYTDIIVTDQNGIFVCDAIGGNNQGANFSDKAYFRNTIINRGFGIGEFQIGQITSKPGIGLGYPIVDQSNNIIGVIAASIDLSWLDSYLSRIDLPEGLVVEVIDHGNLVLARKPSDEKVIGRISPDVNFLQFMLINGEGVYEGKDSGGIDRTFAFAPFKESSSGYSYVIVSLKNGSGFSATSNSLAKSFFWIKLGCVLAFVLSLLLIHIKFFRFFIIKRKK